MSFLMPPWTLWVFVLMLLLLLVLMEEDGVSGQVQGHQRPLDEEHAEDLKRYFESGERRFVPEVILSIRVPLTEEIIDERVVGVNYNKDGVILNRKYESKNLPNHFLRIHKDSLDTLKAEKRIRRIDGNHRLAKAADLKDDVTRPTSIRHLFASCFSAIWMTPHRITPKHWFSTQSTARLSHWIAK